MEMIVFSAEKQDLSIYENTQRTSELYDILSTAGISFKELQGKYQGVSETSFIVPASKVGMVKELCHQFEQECYLELGPELKGGRAAWFVYSNGRKEYQGQLQGQPNKPNEDYTFDPTTSTYYTIV